MSTDSESRSPSAGTSDYYLGESGRQYFEWQRGLGEWSGRVLSRLFGPYVREQDELLDFGCGGGYLLKALRCKRKLGVEINPAAIKECRRNGVEVLDSPAAVQSSSIDLVISNHALEHVRVPLETLVELHRIIRPGGRIVLCTPVDDWRVYRRYEAGDIHRHLHTWTAQNLGNLLAEAGFSVRRVNVFTYAWPPKAMLLDQLLQERVFAQLCRLWGIYSRYRQVLAEADR